MATLADIREQMMTTSGWYDLVNEDLSDNGADKFVNAGIQLLELEMGWHTQTSRIEKTVAAEQELIPFVCARYVQKVYVKDDDDDSLAEIEWVPDPEAASPAVEGNWPVRQIRIDADDLEERTVVIEAVWHSAKLEDDDDYNFWTLQYPDLVEMAAEYARERRFRNTQGANDAWVPVKQMVQKIYHDMVAEEMAGRPDQWIRNG